MRFVDDGLERLGMGGFGWGDGHVRCWLPRKMMFGDDNVRCSWLRKMMVLGWGWGGWGLMVFVVDCHER